MMRVLAILVMGLAVAVAIWSPPEQAPSKRILFIGNSFTYAGDVPRQVGAIAESSAPAVRYAVDMHAFAGVTLEEHLEKTGALEKIRSADWDVVVLQDASHRAFDKDGMYDFVKGAATLADAAQKQGAEVFYYAYWAPGDRRDAQEKAVRTIETVYHIIARQNGSHVAPAGRLWEAAHREGMTGLYHQDGHHASVLGAYAAALAITAALGDVDPSTSSWAPDAVSGDDQALLRRLVRAEMQVAAE